MARRYRALFLKGLRKLYVKGLLVLPPSLSWIKTVEDLAAWLRPIGAKEWMVNVQPPPANCDGPATALGRYVAGTAIGDTRITGDDVETVTIRVKNYREEGEEETLEMPGEEFVRRFASHIVPPTVVVTLRVMTSRIGPLPASRPRCRNLREVIYQCRVLEHTVITQSVMTTGKRTRMLVQCRELLADRIPAQTAPTDEPPDPSDSEVAEADTCEPEPSAPEPPKVCPRCRARSLVFIECYWPWENYDDLGVDGRVALLGHNSYSSMVGVCHWPPTVRTGIAVSSTFGGEPVRS